MENLADKAGDKLGDITSGLTDVAENGGVLPKAGLRVLQGDSPFKALIGEKAKSGKDSVFGKIKGVFGGGEDGEGGGGKGRGAGTKVMNIIEVLDVGHTDTRRLRPLDPVREVQQLRQGRPQRLQGQGRR
ncbi:hypothetical protein ACWKT5_31390 [Streptomyces avermitilis]